MQNTDTEQPWFTDHANLVLLTAHLADTGHTAKTIAYAVEKPWKYEAEFRTAAAILEHESPGHTPRPIDETRWYCDTHVIGACDWTFDTAQVPA
jgi:hypothetical protein